jgi:chaperone LolA
MNAVIQAWMLSGLALARARRQIYLSALFFLIIAPMANAEAIPEAEVKNLLARIRENRITAAGFQEQRIIRLMQKPIVNSGKVWFQPPNKFRREVKGSSPSVTVSDGQQLWIYYPNFKSAERYSLGKRSPLNSIIASINAALNMENIENAFHITATRTGNGYELELTPRTASMKRSFQKLNLRLNDKLEAERTDMLHPNGDRIVTIYSNQTRGTVPSSTFEFTPPTGTDVTTPLGQ